MVGAAARLSARQHGALIILQRLDNLDEYIQSGVQLNAKVTAELLLQIFYPNTPLHDGAVIVKGNRIAAGACVMPLSASGILVRSPERQMGLRHRAALGISEVSDAITVVVSEETGSISIAHAGRIRLRPILMTTFCTLFGLLPLALGLGAGAELQKPLALAVIGGLALSTPVTLLAVPGLYAAIKGRQRRVKKVGSA